MTKNKYVMQDGDIDVEQYLEDNDYASVEDWALDSNYTFNKSGWYWHDEEGNAVDIFTKLWFAIDAMSEDDF